MRLSDARFHLFSYNRVLVQMKVLKAVFGQFDHLSVPSCAKVAALGDAMFSLHHDAFPNISMNYYTRQFTWGYTAWNSSASINQACLAAHPGQDNVRRDGVLFWGALGLGL